MSSKQESYRKTFQTHLAESAQVKRETVSACEEALLTAVQALANAFRSGNKLLLCGNGGSAADCQHVASEFVNRLTKAFEREALPAIALTTDTSFLTSYANDYDYEGVFARQVQALGKAGDVLIGISTSGGSSNVVRAMETARAQKMYTIALMGRGGKLAQVADVAIAVPSENTQYIQEAHLALEHVLCELVETDLFARAQE